MLRRSAIVVSCLFLAASCSAQTATSTPTVSSSPTPVAVKASPASTQAIPRYNHLFIIIEENKSYNQIIGNPNAPAINRLAKTYGLASQFYGNVHPSEANYIAMLGGSTFGIHDDDAYYCKPGLQDRFCHHTTDRGYADHTVTSKSLIDQLQEHHLTWKGYFEDLPAPGSKVVVAPSPDHPLYAVKHNGFLNFKTAQTDPQLAQKIVPLAQLETDLKRNQVPNYSHIIFNQCHEMHGLGECPDLQSLIKAADQHIDRVVQQITQSKLWSAPGNSAIVITWDEDDGSTKGSQGCCGFDPKSAANFGGGHIATIVITNHGPKGMVDPTPYNHYSLLRTTEDLLGIPEYLNGAAATDQGVKTMTPLFAVDRSAHS